MIPWCHDVCGVSTCVVHHSVTLHQAYVLSPHKQYKYATINYSGCLKNHQNLFPSVNILEYQPSGAGGTRSPPATPHRLQNPKWLPVGPKMADRVWKDVCPYVFGHSKTLSLNKFFDPSTPSMRKVDDGETGEGEGKKMSEIVATNVVASQPPKR